jgi:hypothetical protein
VWPAGQTTTVTISGAGFGGGSGIGASNGSVLINSSYQMTWNPISWSDNTIVGNVTPNPLDPGESATVTVLNGNYGMGFQAAPATQSQGVSVQVAPQGQTGLSCPPTVTKGMPATCSVYGVAANRITGWQFVGGGATVTGAGGSLTWSGTMVVSGTVSVTISNPALNISSAQITVNARPWHVAPDPAVQVPGNVLVVAGRTIILPIPPAPQGDLSGLGYSGFQASALPFRTTTVQGGPNRGFTYYASPLQWGDKFFHYVINTDLANESSQFSMNQCGVNGIISWSDLITQTKRHEYNSVSQSHYGYYSASWNTNNVGEYFESRVAMPGFDLNVFNQETGSQLSARFNTIASDTAVEPYPVNSSETGVFLGNINYGPNFQSCTP